MATISPQPKLQFFTANGEPLTGGKLYTYAAGTTTPLATFTDEGGLTPNANPVILNSRGEASVWLGNASYKFKLTDSNDVEIWTVDNLNGTAGISAAALAAATGASLVGYLPDGGGAVATTVQAKLRQFVTPFDFGAVGDGVTDDRAALKAALESGHPVDGCGYTYGINGSCSPLSLVGFQNATLVQIGDRSASDARTLNLVGLSNFYLLDLTINMGTGITTLFSDDGNSGLYIGGTDYLTYVLNFHVNNVTVTGNGCGAGIQIRHAKRFFVDGCLVHDRVSGSSPEPTNDSQNGIQIVNCANFTLSNSQCYNLLTRLSGVDTNKWTRGFLFAEIRDCAIVGCNSTIVDQGYDFSGAYVPANNFIGNRRWTISGCTANSCGTFGYKFANVTRDGLVTGCIANNISTIGFAFSASSVALPPGAEKYNSQNIDVVGCKVVNVLGNGWSSSLAQGFRLAEGPNSVTYPRAIRLKDCAVIDTQDVATTQNAYISDVTNVESPTTGFDTNVANSMSGCTATANIPVFVSGGVGANICQITSNTTQSIPDTAWTELNWNTNMFDPTGLHNVASNNSNIVVKAPGWYRLSAMVNFTANATGIRQIRFLLAGNVVDRCTAVGPGDASADTVLVSNVMVFAESGNTIRVEVFQSSGGALNVKSDESHLAVELIGG
jgi:hypothetical protein